jgi:hypothetical protein
MRAFTIKIKFHLQKQILHILKLKKFSETKVSYKEISCMGWEPRSRPCTRGNRHLSLAKIRSGPFLGKRC